MPTLTPKDFTAPTRRAGLLPLAAAAIALTIAVGFATTDSGSAEARALSSQPRPVLAATATDIALPTLALPVEEAPAPAPAPEPVVASWAIGITAFGWQEELDACQWVLMDMVAEVPLPIVAAHNYCDGGKVLEMQSGEIVTLSGYGLDGTYVVGESRDAWAGGDAAEAIWGMSGDIILQTCYWANDGTERLVAITRIG